MSELTLAQRIRRAELRQRRYRTDPNYRLAAINRTRKNGGRQELGCLTHSGKLHLPRDPIAAKPI